MAWLRQVISVSDNLSSEDLVNISIRFTHVETGKSIERSYNFYSNQYTDIASIVSFLDNEVLKLDKTLNLYNIAKDYIGVDF